jgi:hypothetical protein
VICFASPTSSRTAVVLLHRPHRCSQQQPGLLGEHVVFFLLLCVPAVVPWRRNGPSLRGRDEPVAACSAPPHRRRRLCADHRVEPYACRCRCRRSARAPRLTFISLSSLSAPPCLCRRRSQTAGLHTRARTRREAEGFAFGSPYPAEPKFLPCLAVVRSLG